MSSKAFPTGNVGTQINMDTSVTSKICCNADEPWPSNNRFSDSEFLLACVFPIFLSFVPTLITVCFVCYCLFYIVKWIGWKAFSRQFQFWPQSHRCHNFCTVTKFYSKKKKKQKNQQQRIMVKHKKKETHFTEIIIWMLFAISGLKCYRADRDGVAKFLVLFWQKKKSFSFPYWIILYPLNAFHRIVRFSEANMKTK